MNFIQKLLLMSGSVVLFLAPTSWMFANSNNVHTSLPDPVWSGDIENNGIFKSGSEISQNTVPINWLLYNPDPQVFIKMFPHFLVSFHSSIACNGKILDHADGDKKLMDSADLYESLSIYSSLEYEKEPIVYVKADSDLALDLKGDIDVFFSRLLVINSGETNADIYTYANSLTYMCFLTK